MIDIYLLEQLVALNECGTLSAAAEKLHLTQPSITRSMQKLESLLDVPLFIRSKNRIVLNENGRLAAECAAQILREEQNMITRVRALDRSSRMLSIGMVAPGPMMDLSPLLSSLYPTLTILTEQRPEEALFEGLQNGTYQMIILNHLPQVEGIVCHPCGKEHLYFVVSPDHRIAGMSSCSFSEMNGESFLMATEVGYWEQIVRRNMLDSHFLMQDSLDALAELIQASNLSHFATDITIRLYGRDQGHACIPISDASAIQYYYCCCLSSNEKRYLKWFQALERRME